MSTCGSSGLVRNPRDAIFVGWSLAALSLVGCQRLADLELPPSVRSNIEILERPMPLDQPFPKHVATYSISHPRALRALAARLKEYAEGLENPDLRAGYLKSLAAGEPSRTRAFYEASSERSNDVGGWEELAPAWDRIDDALAAGSGPDSAEERLLVLAAFVSDSDPSAASRLIQAIRDDWNPESETWTIVFGSMENSSDPAWGDAWRAASRKDLDNVLGRAILDELDWTDVPPGIHPFATPSGMELLGRRMRESRDDDELGRLLGQFRALDEASAEALWQAALERPRGLVRLHSAFEIYRRTKSAEGLAEMQASVADERYAVPAMEYLSLSGELQDSERLSGEALARAKAYFSVGHYHGFVDDEIAQTMLRPLISGQARFGDEEMTLSLFHFSMPVAVAEAACDSDGVGLAIVDDGLTLPVESALSSSDVPSAEEYAAMAIPSFQEAYETGAIQTLRDEGCRTFLDVIAAVDLPANRHDYKVAFGRDDALKGELLAEDDRWKAFDVTFESLGFSFPAEENATVEGIAEPESDDADSR